MYTCKRCSGDVKKAMAEQKKKQKTDNEVI